MPKGMRATPVPWTCVDCGFEGVALMTGVVPFRCDGCKTRNRTANNRAARAANPDRAAHHQRTYRLKRYGITPAQYHAMVDRADGRCEICGAEGDLRVDHCHAQGGGRGMLCHGCNVAIGLMKDDPVRLRAAADYLER